MNKSLIYLIPAFLFFSQLTLSATQPISQKAHIDLNYQEKGKSTNGVFAKVKLRIAKKMLKIANQSSLMKQAKIAFIIGAISLALIGLFAVLGLWFILILGYLAAIVGIIYSIIVLQISKPDKETHKRERKKAWLGFIFSLITILAPAALFFVILLLYTI